MGGWVIAARTGGAADPAGLSLRLLGGFAVTVGETRIPETAWRRQAAAKLVALLALAPGHRLHRDQVIETLWPRLRRQAGATNVYRALHLARRALAPALGARGASASSLAPRAASEPALFARGASAYLGLQGEVLGLRAPDDAPPVWIDVEAFEAAAHLARCSRDPDDYAAALVLYSGDLLPNDRYDDWIIRRRDHLRQQYTDLLRDAAQTHEALGNVQRAINLLNRLVLAQPTDEDAQVALMRLLALVGRRDQALRQFETLRTSLRKDLDAEPRPGTLALRRELQAPRPAGPNLDRHTPMGVWSSAPRTNLPAALTSFVGRQAEQAEVRSLLERSRLVSLIGSGGCGKTRLALEVAAALTEAYADGVWLVELAPLVDPELVPLAVAGCLGVGERPGWSMRQTLVEALRRRRLLLVLDNCEHVLDACVTLVVALLGACPEVRILATSRERLRCAGERAWRVPPLVAPDAEGPLPIETLARYDAIRLFVARARSVQADFRLGPHNARAVARICQRLDGLPLAIELATARLEVLSPDEIAAMLGDLLGLLAYGQRSAPARHHTVRATLDWSYRLLAPDEQALLRGVAVFSGGFTRDAAERITRDDLDDAEQHARDDLDDADNDGNHARAGRPLLDLLASLVDKSLIGVDRGAQEARYEMLETVRQYGLERLRAAGDELRLRHAHRDWCLAVAEAGATALDTPDWAAALEDLQAEEGNLLAALAGCLERGEIEPALRLAGALWAYWYMRGDVAAGRRWLEGLLGDARSRTVPTQVRVRALLGAGWFAFHQGDVRTTTDRFEEALAHGDTAARAVALLGLANLARETGDVAVAFSHSRASLALERQLGRHVRVARVLDHLAQCATAAGLDEQALPLTDEALALRRTLGDEVGMARTWWNRGVALLHLGDLDGAEQALERCLRVWRDMGDALGIGVATSFLGLVLALRGHTDRAAVLVAEELTMARTHGVMWGVISGFMGASLVLEQRNQPAQAAQFLGCVEAVTDATGLIVKPPDQRLLDACRQRLCAALGAAAVEAAFQAGRALPLDEAIDAALAAFTQAAASPGARPAGHTADGHLTARERQIATLLVRGATNRQIATSLSLSPRTVDTHVSRILRKSGLASRAELTTHHLR